MKGPNRLNEPKVGNTKITAAELQEQLSQDEEYQKWLKEKEQVRTALEEAYAEGEKPLVEDLKKAGLDITSSWDLVNTKSSDRQNEIKKGKGENNNVDQSPKSFNKKGSIKDIEEAITTSNARLTAWRFCFTSKKSCRDLETS